MRQLAILDSHGGDKISAALALSFSCAEEARAAPMDAVFARQRSGFVMPKETRAGRRKRGTTGCGNIRSCLNKP
jgi:hypothetical protein